MLRYSPKRSQSHRERAPETPPQRSRPRNRSSSPLLRLIRYSSFSSPKKFNTPSVEPILSRAEALRIIDKVSARSRTPVTPASPAQDSPSRPLPKPWKTTPAPASSTKRGPILSNSRHRSSSNSHVRLDNTNDPSQRSPTREVISPPVSVYNAHEDPFRISPRPNQVPFVAPAPNSVLHSSNPISVIKINLPPAQAGSYTTITSSSTLLRVPPRGRPNTRTSPSAQTHPPVSYNPSVSLRQTRSAGKSPISPSGRSTATSRSPSSGPDRQIISYSSEKDTDGVKDPGSRSVLGSGDREAYENDTPSSQRLDFSVPRTSSPSHTKTSRKHHIPHTNTERRPLEPLIIPETSSHHRSDSSHSASSWSARIPGSTQRHPPNALGIQLPSKTNIIPISSIDQGSPSKKEPPGHQSAPPSPTKNPSRRHGLIYGSPDVPLPYIRRSPSIEIVPEIKTDETTPSFESVSRTWKAIPEREKTALSQLKYIEVEDLYSPVSDAIERYFLDDETSAGSINVPTVHVDQPTPPLNSTPSPCSSRSSFTDISPPASPTRSRASSLSPTHSIHDLSLSTSSISSFTAVTESSSLESVYMRTVTSTPKTPPLILRPKTPLHDSPQTTIPLSSTSISTEASGSLARPSANPAAFKTTNPKPLRPQNLHHTPKRPSPLALGMMVPSQSHHRSVSADSPEHQPKKSRLLGLLRLSTGGRAEHRRVPSTSTTGSTSSTLTREPTGSKSSPQSGITESSLHTSISASTKKRRRLSDVVGMAVSLKRMATRGPDNSSSRAQI